MKITVEDTSALPEWQQAYVQEGQLDLTALPQPEDVSGLKTALQKERANVQAWSKLGEKPEDVQAKIADLEERARGTGKSAEEAQAKLDAIAKEKDAEIAKRDERLNGFMRSNAQSALKSELAKVGFIPESIDDIAATAMNRLQFNDDGSPKVVTSEGSPMIGSGPDHGATLADLARELAASKTYAVRDDGKGGGGKPPGSNGGTPNGKRFSEMTSSELVSLRRENPQEYDRLKAEG